MRTMLKTVTLGFFVNDDRIPSEYRIKMTEQLFTKI